jgi:hypothetical protein
MSLGDEDVKEFQTIYEEDFGEPISHQEASILASRLVMLYEALARPLLSERTQFTDSIEGVRLKLEVGAHHSDKPLTSEKVDL